MSVEDERSIRQELAYTPWSCALCRARFFTMQDVEHHFILGLSRHPESPLSQFTEVLDLGKERRVHDALALLRRQKAADTDPPKESAEAGQNTLGSRACHCRASKTDDVAIKVEENPNPDDSTSSLTNFFSADVDAVSDSGREGRGFDLTHREEECDEEEELDEEEAEVEEDEDGRELQEGAEKVDPASHTKNAAVECQICNDQVNRKCLRKHILAGHLDDSLFACRQCEYGSVTIGAIRQHCMTHHLEHAVDGDLRQVFIDRRNHGVYNTIRRLHALAFPSTRIRTRVRVANEANSEVSAIVSGPFTCRGCEKKLVIGDRSHVKIHVATQHMRQDVYACGDCAYASQNWYGGAAIKRHRIRKHPRLSPHNFQDRRLQLEKQMNHLVWQYFEIKC